MPHHDTPSDPIPSVPSLIPPRAPTSAECSADRLAREKPVKSDPFAIRNKLRALQASKLRTEGILASYAGHPTWTAECTRELDEINRQIKELT